MVVGRRRQGQHAQREDQRRPEQPLGRARRPEGRRAGDGRRLPEAADDAAGHAGEGRALAARRRLPATPSLPRRPPLPPAAPSPDRSATGMAKFFIDRPIFAWVIALFIIVMGAVAITQLPISQYPPVAPPAIVITASLPRRLGADAGRQRAVGDRARNERLARPDLHGVGGAGQRHRHRSPSPSRPAPTRTWRRWTCRTACRAPRRACRRR